MLNIPSNSLIVMDNAPYHKTLSSFSPPTPSCSKERILTWLILKKSVEHNPAKNIQHKLDGQWVVMSCV